MCLFTLSVKDSLATHLVCIEALLTHACSGIHIKNVISPGKRYSKANQKILCLESRSLHFFLNLKMYTKSGK